MEPITQPSMEPGTQLASGEHNDALRRYYALDPETLSQLLNDKDIKENVILEIQPIRVYTSPAKQSMSVKQSVSAIQSMLAKPMSTGVITFIGKRPKISILLRSRNQIWTCYL